MEMNILEVKKAKRGDAAAFARLYEQIYPDLYRFALYTLKHTSDAEDAVSETVTDAFASIRKLKKAESFKGWMFRILYNKCKDNGYRLIHIFEDEWTYKKDIVKSRLKNILGMQTDAIYAR